MVSNSCGNQYNNIIIIRGLNLDWSMSTRLTTSTSLEFQTNHVSRALAYLLVADQYVEVESVGTTLICYVVILSMRSRFEKSYLCSIS